MEKEVDAYPDGYFRIAACAAGKMQVIGPGLVADVWMSFTEKDLDS